MRRLGSGLLLVMLIVAGVTTVTLGTQRVALVQFSQAVREEDSLKAFYAAQAGIEDGLLRFRHSRNVETAPGNVYRYGLSDGRFFGEVSGNAAIQDVQDFSANKQYYDLSISYKSSHISDLEIRGNESIDLSGFRIPEEANVRALHLRVTATFSEEADGCLVQLQTLPRSVIDPNPKIIRPGAAIDRPVIESISLGAAGNFVDTVRIRVAGADCQDAYTVNLDIDLTARGGADEPPLDGVAFDSLTTTITSVGYFGSVRRTLIATIDRRTGHLISVYDHTILAGGDIRPRR